MIANDSIKIAIAETSMIIRNGIALMLKNMPGYKVIPIEVYKPNGLLDSFYIHKPDILIINPVFMGYIDMNKFKEEVAEREIKCIALICSVVDKTLPENYDASVSLYDEAEDFYRTISSVLGVSEKEDEITSGQDVLSNREKEIITCIVKGLTNKEIADKLFLSAHTVITHRRNITRKLQIHSSAGLTIYAIVNKLVDIKDIKDTIS